MLPSSPRPAHVPAPRACHSFTSTPTRQELALCPVPFSPISSARVLALACMEARDQHQKSSLTTLPYPTLVFLRHWTSPTRLDWLAAVKASRILLLPLPLQHQGKKHGPRFLCGCWGSTLGCLCLNSKHFMC